VGESHRWGAGYAYWCVLLRRVRHRAVYVPHDVHDLPRPGAFLDHHAQEHFHDVGWDMKAPLVALAIPSLLIGFFTIEPVLFGGYFGDAIKVLPGTMSSAISELIFVIARGVGRIGSRSRCTD
jgi:NADH-quinone oxidoreductase subunit L